MALDVLLAIGLCLVGYLMGSFSFSLWITKIFKGVDVRDAGSGHATTTNTIRQVGWAAGVFVFVLDFLKGFFPTWLALRYAPFEWVIPIVAGLAVAGHCWPIFAGFRGGMGLATAAGGLAAVDPKMFFVALACLIILVLVIKHSARAALVGGFLLAPIVYAFGGRGTVVWLSVAVGLVLAIRFFSDWDRKYRELWLDREKEA